VGVGALPCTPTINSSSAAAVFFFPLPAAVLILLRPFEVRKLRFHGGRFMLHFPPSLLKLRLFVLELQNFAAAVSRQKIFTTKNATKRKEKSLSQRRRGTEI
jgi:hypothetical protein